MSINVSASVLGTGGGIGFSKQGEDRFLASLLVDKEEYKREEVLKLMGDKAKSYSVYRDRLLKRGVISARQGYIGLNPPFFADYVKEYC